MDGMKASAVISDCGLYRYRLSRIWDESKPVAVFVMLNPSTADYKLDDPTIRKCMGFARRWGCGAIEVVNLFALRSRFPSIMKRSADPVGPDNNKHLAEVLTLPGAVVCLAWGTHGGHMGRGRIAREACELMGVKFRTLGFTKGGHPKHPLMQPYPKEAP